MTERVAVIGSRVHPNLELVREYVRSLPAGTVVVSGGAEGVDDCAAGMAIALGHGLCTHRPIDRVPLNNELSHRDRLLWRNTMIALDCDRMVVFPDGSKGGCWDAAREAVRFKRPVEIRWCNGEVQPFSKSIQKRIGAQMGGEHG